ncbi:MAG: ribonuclease HII [Bacilli bacterium]|jgi:ribonuclease HII|nr:ribonuclease HII [Bacilli bacterium]MCH4210464.1 ribonuclease HII [Bacilli bacterium]MCH4228361.1 ribonuclease HII [Bacilli bacterium]MCH4277637.1 ribonuclease HII [Bacilli bacterium]MCI2054823.1 ribonuclease HII [Bacilli bacterium]
MLVKEREFYSKSVKAIVGIDEAGRGPLAGPVYAAAVVFDESFVNDEINDSKKLTSKEREKLFLLIKEKALGYGIASVSAEDIDKYNIYQATKICMMKALSQIKVPYQLIITDAMPLKDTKVPLIAMVKGDAQCLNVAAASILAKVSRDHYMEELDEKYPEYGFKKHKGYGTKLHMEALEKYGPIDGVHRKSFRPVNELYIKQGHLF